MGRNLYVKLNMEGGNLEKQKQRCKDLSMIAK
jgi:hypothetical protein